MNNDIIFNDLDDEYVILSKHDKYFEDEIFPILTPLAIDENGVKISACAEDMSYNILTDKWNIYWYDTPTDRVMVYKNSKCILDIRKKFDISYFCTVEDNTLLPGNLNILHSSSELIDNKIQNLLNLRAFL